ncbi:MAG: hypothetical protein IBX54_14955 [Rhodoferax sp.]|nr:hypothetical protein [Rhodoferax sp.]MBE0475460.1 hypothetical protein [Rhodoferax sp.]
MWSISGLTATTPPGAKSAGKPRRACALATVRDYAHVHVSSGDLHDCHGLDQLQAQFGALDFFCINDTTDDAYTSDPRLSQVRAVLARLLPDPSRFEKPVLRGKPGVHKHQLTRVQALSA